MRQFPIEACFFSLVFGSVLAVSTEDEKTFMQKSKGADDFDDFDIYAKEQGRQKIKGADAEDFDAEEDGTMDGTVSDAMTPSSSMTGNHARKLQFSIPKFPGLPKQRKNKCKTLKDANGCGGMCPSDYILALLPDPKAQTCPRAGWRIPYPKFKAFPGMDFLMAKSLELALGSVGAYTNGKLGKDAVHVRFCDGFVGMADNMRYCVVKFNLAKVMPRIGGKKLFVTNIVFCFAFTPSLSPFIATAFSNLNFDFWPLPFAIAFTGSSLSLSGCLEVTTKAYLSTSGVVITGRKLKADMGISVAMSWGFGVPGIINLALVCRMQAYIGLDPRKDGRNMMPHDVILQLFRQECSDAPHPATDWQFWFQSEIALELTVAGRFTFSFPFKIHSQIFIDSDSKNTNIYISFALSTINNLADLLGSDYRKVQKLGGEKFACISLAYKTGLPSKLIPYCHDFIFFKKSISVFVTYETGQAAIALSFNEGQYTARIMKTDNGYSFCLNTMCQNNIGFTDSDCGDGYSKHNIGSNASWTCRRVQMACFCVTHYSSRPFTESCSGACYMDALLHSTADKRCKRRGNGGKAYCIDKPVPPQKVIQTGFCNRTKGGRRMGSWWMHKRRLTSKCPGSRRQLKVSCVDSQCSFFAGPSTCVRGLCRCRPGYCPSKDGTRCEVAADMNFDDEILSSEEAQGRQVVPGTLDDLFEPKFAPDVHAEPVQTTTEGYRAKPRVTTTQKSGNSGSHRKVTTVPPFMKHGRSLQFGERGSIENNFQSTTKNAGKPKCKCGAHLALVLKLFVDDPIGMTGNPKTKAVLHDTLWNILKRDAKNTVKKSDIHIQSVSTKGRRLAAHGRRLAGSVTVAYTIENYPSSVPPKVDSTAMQAEINNQNKKSGINARVTTASIGEPDVAVEIANDGSQELMITPPSSFVGGGDTGVFPDAGDPAAAAAAAAALEEEKTEGGIHPVISVTIVLVVFCLCTTFACLIQQKRVRNSNDQDNNTAKTKKKKKHKATDADDMMDAEKSKDGDNPDFDGIDLSFGQDQDMDGADSFTDVHDDTHGKAPDDMVRPEPEWEIPVAPEHGMIESFLDLLQHPLGGGDENDVGEYPQ